MALKRFPNWLELLDPCVQQAHWGKKTFQWGIFDCALFVCDCILTITGVDPGKDFRGKYTTQEEAAAIMQQFAGGGIEALAVKMAAQLQMPEIKPVTFAQRGDIVLVSNSRNDRALGIVGFDARFVLCASEQGLARVPMKRWLRAWKAG